MTQDHDNLNPNDRQTEFAVEEQHLEAVVATVDETIRHRELRGPVDAGDRKAANVVNQLLTEGLEKVRSVRNMPYFGRIDYSAGAEGEVDTVYIGDVNIYHEDPRYFIASRNAPIAKLYYQPAAGFYDVPAGRQNASIYLKRSLTIEDAKLLDFDDVLRLPPGPAAIGSTSSRTLDEKLSGTGGDQLLDAVQTIQPEQYEQIASTEKPVLIVQGAAGSGKSLIGLHRIDFILSPFSELGNLQRPTVERVIIFGPSPAFLEYVSGLLPGLGVNRVRQTTVSRWLLGQFSSRVTLSRGDRLFANLMKNRLKLTEAETQAHLFKTSLKMKRLVDNYVDHAKRDLAARAGQNTDISIPGIPTLDVSASELEGRVAEVLKTRPQPNVARTYLVNRLAEEWAREQPRRGKTRSEVIEEARKLVESRLAFWPRIDFRTEYMKIVSSPGTIMKYSRKGDVDLLGAEDVARTVPSGAGQALGMTDLSPALYLDYAINGFNSERFEHVVVDEAQDVSPLEIVLMQMHSVNNSFSILGDLRQSALPYKSISNWNQLASLFEKGSVSRLQSRLTYRSTRQITQYANRILQGLPERTKMPIPYRRTGDRPRLVASDSAAGMRKLIAASVRRLTGSENRSSVAILTKWARTADDIVKALLGEGIKNVGLLTPDGLITTDVTVCPIILTKGLEFDAVIVANVRNDNFNESDFDRMLLYLACTRARHHLEIHWYGTRSPIVPDVARLTR